MFDAKKDENKGKGPLEGAYNPRRDAFPFSMCRHSALSADAFGLMAIAYREPSRTANFNRQLTYADPKMFV